ncbi:MAG: hypothetical protein HBSAPP04_24500 [Ignavibacteriaceae bacterium]|nr:MAG: hypothetical protein EDM75_10945 [Chlorobiota bacterium]GJQ33611.1 MAG: hypothetical protein HBSAPP04_24500 [Ignavibacteriaceae bacterium]
MDRPEDYYGLIAVIYALIPTIMLWGVFRKAGEPGWVAIIPVVNLYYLLKITKRTPLWIVLFISPLFSQVIAKGESANMVLGLLFLTSVFVWFSIMHSLSTAFGKGFFFTIGLILFGFIFVPVLAFGSAEYVLYERPVPQTQTGRGGAVSRDDEEQPQPVSNKKPPLVLSGLIQPGLPGKIYTLFFMDEGMVAVKTGSGSTNASGSMRAFHGGAGATANIMGGLGALMDMHSANKRGNYLGQVGGMDTNSLLAENKVNFLMPYDAVQQIEMKGPGMMGEMKVMIHMPDKVHKFRVDTRSDSIAKMFYDVFTKHCPGRVLRS